MNVRMGTIFFLLSVVVCIAVYDVIVYLRHGSPATISAVILNAAYSPPYGALLPLGLGVLLGHLLVPMRWR